MTILLRHRSQQPQQRWICYLPKLLLHLVLCLTLQSTTTSAFLISSSNNNTILIPLALPLSPSSATSSTIATATATTLYAKRTKKKAKAKTNTICINRQARRNYEIMDTLEVGISLVGTEVKSIRDGKMNLHDGYVRPTKDGRSCILYNVHISKHTGHEFFQHEERCERRLLVHKEQSRKLLQQTEQKGITIVPLKAYFNDNNRIKLEIGLCRGKNVRDKREDIKNREAKREEQRIIKSFRI